MDLFIGYRMEVPLWDRKWIGQPTDDFGCGLRCVDLYLVPEDVYQEVSTDERVELLDINEVYTLDVKAFERTMLKADLKCNYRMITLPRDVERIANYTFSRDVSKRAGFAEYVLNRFYQVEALYNTRDLSCPFQPYTRHTDEDEHHSVVLVFSSYDGSAFRTYNVHRLLKKCGFDPPIPVFNDLCVGCSVTAHFYWKYSYDPFRLIDVTRHTLNLELERLKRDFSFYETLTVEMINERRVPFDYHYAY